MEDDALTQFNWDDQRRQIQQSLNRITELKVQMIKVDLNWVECLKGCDVLKKKLICLIQKLEQEMMLAQRYLEFQANRFKNRIMNSVLAKKIMGMNIWLKSLLALSSAGLVISGIAIGCGVEAATIAGLKIGLRYVVAGSAIGIVLAFAIDFGISWWKASKNEDTFKKAIIYVQNAINQIRQGQRALS